ncbi:MAG: GAF domain-containing protein [Candidatus Electrothrix sp. AX2]|nr:GAF domain-containing protein [Candidatus Electrothrix gigas]
MTTSTTSYRKEQYNKLEKKADEELEKLHRDISFDRASIQIIEDNQRYLVGAYNFSKENSQRFLREIKHDLIVSPIVKDKKARILSNVEDEPLWNTEKTPNIRSWICAPLIFGDDVIGLLTLDHSERFFYTEKKHRETIEYRARDIAIRIYQSYFLHKSEWHIKKLETLINIGNVLSSKIRIDENDLFKLVEKYARERLDIDNITIVVRDKNMISFPVASRNGAPLADIGGSEWKSVDIHEGRGKTQYIIENRKSLVLYHAKYLFDENDERGRYNNSVLYPKDYDENKDKKYKFSRSPNGNNDAHDVPDYWIGVPIKLGERVLGSINAFSFEHSLDNIYDQEVLEGLAAKTAIALQSIRLHKKQEELVEFSQNLSQSFSQNLSQLIKINEEDILKLVHESASKILDTANMYIALYDKKINQIRFFVYEKGNPKVRETRQKKEGVEEGKTEYIIRTGAFLFHPTRKESEEWYVKNNKKIHWDKEEEALPPSPSWIGVPMMLRDDNIGAIATYHPTEEHLYTDEDIGILQLMANSVAIALNNIRRYKKSLELEKISYLSRQVGSLSHRMGNKCGMIRWCIIDLKDRFKEIEFTDEVADDNIKTIEEANQYLIDLSSALFKPGEVIEAELRGGIDVIQSVKEAQKYANIPKDIIVNYNYPEKLSNVVGNKYLVEVFQELIINAVKAMEKTEDKILTINIDEQAERIKIKFSDTGEGVPSDEEKGIFELFSRHTDNKVIDYGHHGFGLWWVKMFLEQIGGKIKYEQSQIDSHDHGASFIVELAIDKSSLASSEIN